MKLMLSVDPISKLIEFALDELVVADQNEGCCPVCCAPCNALKQLLDQDSLDHLYAPRANPDIWVDGHVDRDFLTHVWRRTDCHALKGADEHPH